MNARTLVPIFIMGRTEEIIMGSQTEVIDLTSDTDEIDVIDISSDDSEILDEGLHHLTAGIQPTTICTNGITAASASTTGTSSTSMGAARPSDVSDMELTESSMSTNCKYSEIPRNINLYSNRRSNNKSSDWATMTFDIKNRGGSTNILAEPKAKTYYKDLEPPELGTANGYQLDGEVFGRFSILPHESVRVDNHLTCERNNRTQDNDYCSDSLDVKSGQERRHLGFSKDNSNVSLNLQKLRSAVSNIKVAPSPLKQQDEVQICDISDCESDNVETISRHSSVESRYQALEYSDISIESDTEKSNSRPSYCNSDIGNLNTPAEGAIGLTQYSRQSVREDNSLGLGEVCIDLITDSDDDSEASQPSPQSINVLKKLYGEKHRGKDAQNRTDFEKRKERKRKPQSLRKEKGACTINKKFKRIKPIYDSDSDHEYGSPKKKFKNEGSGSLTSRQSSIQHLLQSADSMPDCEEDEVLYNSNSLIHSFRNSTKSHHIRPSKPSIDGALNSDILPKTFTSAHIHTIEACLEEGDSFDFHVAKMVEDFTTSKMVPSEKMVVDILKDILMKSKDRTLTSKACKALRHIQFLHPPQRNIPFQWDHIDEILKNLSLLDGVNDQEPLSVVNNVLGLDIIVSYLEMELTQHNLSDQRDVRESVASRWLSVETSFQHVRQVLAWFCNCLLFGQDDFSRLCHRTDSTQGKNGASLCYRDIPEVLPLIQKLLSLSLIVTPHPVEGARKVAVEIAKNYIMQPNIETRRILLSTICNHLLRLHVVQNILENYCNGNYATDIKDGCGNLAEMLQGYKDCVPPPRATGNLTPPSSPYPNPSHGSADIQPTLSHSNSDAEEQTMLLFMLLESYIRIKKEKLYLPIWSRQNIDLTTEEGELTAEDTASFRFLPDIILELKAKFLREEGQASTRVTMYLNCMESLIEDCSLSQI